MGRKCLIMPETPKILIYDPHLRSALIKSLSVASMLVAG
jgi:hypothetical protein